MPPPDEIHRGVEIVVGTLVVVGGGGSRKRLWYTTDIIHLPFGMIWDLTVSET